MSSDPEEVTLQLPLGITLEQVIIDCDPDTMVIKYSDKKIKEICDANQLPHSIFLDDEMVFTNLLVAWYEDLKSIGADIPANIDLFFTKCLEGYQVH